MSQNREPPAFQEYAATMLSKLSFRTMPLQDRGLLYTMRLECWVNKQLPSNHHDLAKVLGQPVEEVTASLAAVMEFFEIDGNFIVCPELESYRVHLAERKLKQSQGGKRGSAITNDKRSRKVHADNPSDLSSNSSTNPQVSRQGSVESSVQSNTAKPSQTQFSKKGAIDDPFVRDYEAAEQCSADAYAKASKGY
ncbi:MAG: hypothetical protein H6937_11800 [Burkholderiales bacterium]|nr:hypothetical protein [Burkholderiales bacterium]